MNGKALEQRTALSVSACTGILHWDSLSLTLLQELSHWLTGAYSMPSLGGVSHLSGLSQ